MDNDKTKKKKYKLGYALSGGGAKGFAHAGAIKALEEVGLKPDIIAGTSAGSVVGALYCSGKSPEEIKQIFLVKRRSDFLAPTLPKSGIFKHDNFTAFLEENIPYKRLQSLPIPLYICATNFDKGKTVIFKSGDIPIRVMASCCIPLVFNLVEINGVHYADGGIFKNLPVSPIRDLCDIIIGINVVPAQPEYKDNVLFIAQQSFNYMLRANMLEDKSLCDVLVETNDVSRYSTFDLDKAEEIFELGYKKMKRVLGRLTPEMKQRLGI